MSPTNDNNSDADDIKNLRKEGRLKAGRYLKQMREISGKTQREIAIAVGFQYYTFVSQIEGGHGKLPYDTWATYASVLGVTPASFANKLVECYTPEVFRMQNTTDKKD